MTRYWSSCGSVLGTCRWVRRAWCYLHNRLVTLFWRLALAECGRGSLIQAGVAIERPRSVRIGPGCLVTRGALLTSETCSGELVLAAGVQVNAGARLDYSGGLQLLAGTLVSEEALIMTHSHGYDPHSPPRATPLTIGRDAWVGARAIILPTVASIGEGAVVGAGAVVSRDVAARAVVVGNPARVVGMRPGVEASPLRRVDRDAG